MHDTVYINSQYLKKIIAIVFFIFIQTSTALFSQSTYTTNSFRVSTLSQDNGLSQASNFFKFEDSKGFMWITCYDAVNRYDGKFVKVYNKDFYFLNCPTLQQGYGFAEDSLSNIYVGSLNGLYIYNRKKDRFTLQKIFKNAIDDIAMPFAFKDGKIWCYNRQFNIAAFDISTNKTTYFNAVQLEPLVSIHAYLFGTTYYLYRQPFFDKNGILWVANINNVARYDVAKNSVTYPLQSFLKISNDVIFSSCYNPAKHCILYGTKHSVIEFDLYKNVLKKITKIGNQNFEYINYMEKFGNGYCITTLERKSFFLVDENLTSIQVLNQDKINHNKIDVPISFNSKMNNNLWMRDDGYGFYILDFNKQPLQKELGGEVDNKEIFISSIHQFAELPNKDVLVLSIPNMFLQNHQTKILKLKKVFENEKVLRIRTDSFRKGVWLNIGYASLSKSYLQFYDGIKNQLTNDKIFIDDSINGLLQDIAIMPNTTMLAAFSKGIFWIDDKVKKIIPIAGLEQLNAFKISILDNHYIAISYLNNTMQIVTLDETNKAIKTKQAILKGTNCFYTYYNIAKEQYWIGSDAGLFLLDKNFAVIKKFNANNGLPANYIYGLLNDDIGNVWISHQLGISSINTTSHKIINYTKEDGLQDWDFNNRCFAKTSDGTLYFGGRSGFNYFKPPIKPQQFYAPEVYVDEILCNNKFYVADTNANLINNINVSYNTSSLVIKAIAKSLGNANSLEIVYRLKNKDSTWLHLPNNSSIVLNNLASGSYILEIGYSSRFTENFIAQKTIEINVSTPFFKALWFWLLIAMGFSGIITWLYYRRNFRKQKRKYEQQLAIEKERTRIIDDLHDDIGSSISSINMYSTITQQLVETDVPKAKTMLDKLSSQSQKLMENLSEIIWSMKTDTNQLMTLDTRIKTHISDVLGAAEIQYSIDIEPNIDLFINNIQARKNIMLIVKEATNNITRYSKATNVHIALHKKTNTIILTIKDNGIGFQNKATQGNGMNNIKKRAAELNGTCTITSNANEGVEIVCIFKNDL